MKSTTGGQPIGGGGSGQPDGPVGGHSDTDRSPGGGTTTCPIPGDCPGTGDDKPKKHDPTNFEKALNSIGGSFNAVAGELNGTNNKKRKKAREAKSLLRDAQDTFKQVDDLGAAISQEMGAINTLGSGLGQTKNGFELNASDQVFGDITTRYNSKTKGILDKTPEFDEGKDPATANNGQGVYYENQKIATGRKYAAYAREHVESLKGQPDYDARKSLVNMADEALNASEASYREGKPAEGSVYYEAGMALADVALSLTPIIGVAKDAIELATGKSILTGRPLTAFERSVAGVGVATLGLVKFGAFGKLAKIGGIIAKGAIGAEDAAKIAKGLERGEDIAVAASKAGIKDKGLIEEAADAVKQGMPCSLVEVTKSVNYFWLFEDVAYAGDCIPGSGEDTLEKMLESSSETAARPRVPGGEERLAKFPEPKEKKIAGFLEDLGRKVEKNEMEGVEGAGRQSDAIVDGVKTEFKTVETANPDSNTIKNIVAGGVGQARTIVIDSRGTALTQSDAARGIFRSIGANPGKIDYVSVIGNDFFIGFGPR